MTLTRVAVAGRPLLLGYQALIAIFSTVFISWVIFRPGGDSGALWFSDITLTTTSLIAGLVTMIAAMRMTGRDRRSWFLIATGILAWSFGIAAWSYYEIVLKQETPFPSLADLGYLSMIPLLFAGLVSIPATKAIARETLFKVVLDAILIMASIATVSWFFVIGPTYTSSEGTLIEKAIGLAYPAGDLVLLFAIIGGIARGWASGRNPVFLALILGITSFIVADTSFAYLTLHNSYVSGNPIDLGWPLGLLLISYAAVRRWAAGEPTSTTSRTANEGQTHTLLRQVAPYALVFTVAVLLFYSRFSERGVFQNIFVAASLTTMLLVMVRQFVTVRENERLATKLRSFSEELESKVAERTSRLSLLHQVASALSAASSIEEVTQVALTALHQEASCRGAAFYVPASVGAPEHVCKMTLGKAPPGSSGELWSVIETTPSATPTTVSSGEVIIHLPVAAHGEPLGTVILTGISEHSVVDTQSLETIGSEFGVAYENQLRYREAIDLADRDPVTGLFNHRYFHKQIDVQVQEHSAVSKSFGLVIMDIDDFKLFNDTYGHPKGDAVLKLIASHLLEIGEKYNIVPARFGGDEFAILLPDRDLKATVEFMRQFREWVQLQSYQENGGERIPIRISMGYAMYPEDGTRAYAIVAVADSALYDAKRAGAFGSPDSSRVSDIVEKGGSFKLLEGLITAVDNKDQYTKAHCDLVAEFAVMIAAGLGLSVEVQRSLAVAGALHDVGKICIPDRILRKPGALTDEEYETVKMHVPMASSLIQNVPRRKDVLDAVMNHHERYDGSGYLSRLEWPRDSLRRPDYLRR